MGLMDKLKNAVNSITGGGAKVTITTDKPSREGPFKVKVKAVVADQPLQVSRVYVQLNGHETVVVHNVQHKNFTRDETEFSNTFDQEFNIAEAQTLNAKGEYEWEAQVEFPKNVPPTYRGRNATHELRILAGLDTKGNDPDSGWVVLAV